MASTEEQSKKHTRKFVFGVLNYNFLSLNRAKKHFSFPKRDFIT